MSPIGWTSLSPRNRRALTVAAVFLGCALLVRFGALPYLGAVRERGERLSRERELLNREIATIRDSERYPATFERIASGVVEYAPRLLPGDSRPAALAALERIVGRHTADAPLTVKRVEAPRAPADTAAPPSASLRVEMETDLEGLLSVLAGLEAEPLLLRIDEVVARVVRRTEPPGDGRAPPEVLAAAFTVTGFTVAADGAGGDTVRGEGAPSPDRRTGAVAPGRRP